MPLNRTAYFGKTVFLVFAIALTSACASTTPTSTFHPYSTDPSDVLWPEPPEVPRYRYLGQLRGEANFGNASESENFGVQLARWIVGLGRIMDRRPNELLRPQSGTVGPDGRIYVTDVGRRAVFVFDMAAGKLRIWDRADRGVSFDSPIGIAPTATGTLLVADSGLGRVVQLTPEGRPIGSFGEGLLQRPTGVAWSDSGIYVADSGDDDIKVFDESGRLIRRIGTRGEGRGELNGPTHLAVREGQVYVSDTLNARVQVFDTSGNLLRQVGSRGLYVGNFTRPKGIAVDSDGNLYVVESYYDHLVIFDQSGNYLLPVRGADLSTGNFFLPAGVWSDDLDRIFLADMYNSRVLILQYLGR